METSSKQGMVILKDEKIGEFLYKSLSNPPKAINGETANIHYLCTIEKIVKLVNASADKGITVNIIKEALEDVKKRSLSKTAGNEQDLPPLNTMQAGRIQEILLRNFMNLGHGSQAPAR